VKKVVPSVLTRDAKDLEKKIRALEPFADVIQVDIMDGEFVPNTSVGVTDVQRVGMKSRMEAHLMVKHPIDYVQAFAAFRIVFHIESDDNPEDVIREIKQFGMEAGVALNPPTPVEKIKPLLNSLDLVLVMSVNPGLQGQKFIPEVLAKVRAIRDMRPEITIEVDGGVNPETGPALVEAGVDILNVGSYFFKQLPVKNNWERMQEIISER
jgi:ribulose-phosphate 3-epimerase